MSKFGRRKQHLLSCEDNYCIAFRTIKMSYDNGCKITSTLRKESVCRTCLTTTNLQPLFTDTVANFSDMLHNIRLATGLQIKINDGLPQNICRKCSKSIKFAVRFRRQCQDTEAKLNQLFDNTEMRSVYSIPTEAAPIEEENSSNGEMRQQFKCHYAVYDKECEPSNISHFIPEQESSDDAFLSTICNKPEKSLSYERKRYMELIEGPVVPKKPILCKICKKYSKCLNSFEKHAMSHLGYNILCEFCGKSCISTANLLRHQRRKHGLARDNSFPCSACGFQAIEREQLEVHERRVHTKERPFMCTDCGAAFFSKRVLIQHKANHKTEKPFQCDLCPLKFKLRCRLTKHIHRVHTKNYCKYNYGCYLCDKRYSRTHHVRKHIFKIHRIPLKQQGQVQRYAIESTYKVACAILPNISPLHDTEANFRGNIV